MTAEEERAAARQDPRQLQLPFVLTIQEMAYNLGREARRQNPDAYDREGRPILGESPICHIFDRDKHPIKF